MASIFDSQEKFEESINTYTDRKELLAHLKKLKDYGVWSGVKTKDKSTYALVIEFLIAVESIPMGSELEKIVTQDNQAMVILYNDLADRVEKNDVAQMTDNFKANIEVAKVYPKDVQEVMDFAYGDLVETSKKVKESDIKKRESDPTEILLDRGRIMDMESFRGHLYDLDKFTKWTKRRPEKFAKFSAEEQRMAFFLMAGLSYALIKKKKTEFIALKKFKSAEKYTLPGRCRLQTIQKLVTYGFFYEEFGAGYSATYKFYRKKNSQKL